MIHPELGSHRPGFLDLFRERTSSLLLEWRHGSSGVLRGLRAGTAERWSRPDGLVHSRSISGSGPGLRDQAASDGAQSVEDLTNEPDSQVQEGPAKDLIDYIEEVALGLARALAGTGFGMDVEGRAQVYEQVVTIETPHRSCTDHRGGVRIEVRASAGEALLERRVADRSLVALRGRVPPQVMSEDLAVSLLQQREASVVPEGELRVIFGGRGCGAWLHEIGHLFEEDMERSPLGRLGDMVGPAGMTVVDDPSHRPGRGSYAFDDEGAEACARLLIEEGRLVGSLGRRGSGRFDGGAALGDRDHAGASDARHPERSHRSHGHARRASYLDPPIPRMSCTILAKGTADPAEILRTTARGLYISRLKAGRLDPVSGRITLLASEGRLVEKGRLTRPIAPCLLVAQARDLLRSIDGIGSDLELDGGSGDCVKDEQQIPVMVGLPTVRTGLVRVLAP